MFKKLVIILILLFNFLTVFSIDVSSCQNINSAGNYVLTQSISVSGSDCISITSNNVHLNCNNFNISGDNSDPSIGINVNSVNNSIIENCQVSNFDTGILFQFSNNHSLSNTLVKDNLYYGIEFIDADNSSLSSVNVYNSTFGVFLNGFCDFNTFTNINSHNNSDYGFVMYTGGINNTISNSDFRYNNFSVYLENLFGSPQNNTITSSYLGDNSSVGGSAIVGNYFAGNYYDDWSSNPYCLDNAPSVCDSTGQSSTPTSSPSNQQISSIFPSVGIMSILSALVLVLGYFLI